MADMPSTDPSQVDTAQAQEQMMSEGGPTPQEGAPNFQPAPSAAPVAMGAGPAGPGAGPEQPLPPLERATPETGAVPLDPNGEGALFGPTQRPDESITRGVGPALQHPAPPNVDQWLPDLVAASRAPDAPPQLQNLVKLIMYHMQNS